jgi:hypothetical protein
MMFCCKFSEVVNLDDPKMWLRVCSQRVELFQKVTPAMFENLAIAQHMDTLGYAIIRGGGYNHQFVGSMSICSRLH